MKISHFLISVGIITLASLVYVWQQVQILESNYALLKMEKQLTKLVDQNRILKYNIFQLKSPETIEKKLLASHIKLKYTSPIMITQLKKTIPDINIAKDIRKPSFLGKAKKALSGIFALRSQVEAMP